MSTLVYAFYNENASEAIEFYHNIFGGKDPIIMRYGEYSDENYQPEERIKNLVMHAKMFVFGSRIMIADTPKGFGNDWVEGNNFSFAVVDSNVKKLKAAWDKLIVGGKVLVEFKETFFSEGYGHVIDKFGMQWQFIHEKKE